MKVLNMPESASLKKAEEAPILINTADWKTYNNETFGLEFRYPTEWYVKEEEGRFLLFDSSSCHGSCPQKIARLA